MNPAAPITAPGLAVPMGPDGVVNDFYRLVLTRSFDSAAALRDDHMRETYPPEQNINQRFASTTVLTVNRASVAGQDAGSATVDVELTEVTEGVQYHWVGTWTLVRSADRWLLDQPNFQPA